MKTILLVFGTRPEAIKLAPVISELRNRPGLQPIVCVTGQHREMLAQVLDVFDIKPEFDLGIMAAGQTLPHITTGVLTRLEPVIQESAPSIVMVQGDTTTAMTASLAAYYARTPLAHVEAGLRTNDKFNPFPEEVNRRVADLLADICFAPTALARQNLLDEGVDPARIHVTGNTVIDALLHTIEAVRDATNPPRGIPDRLASILLKRPERRMILVTGHRRESFGNPFRAICRALRDLATRNPDIDIVYPVHLNPNVREPVYDILSGVKAVHLIDPLEYPAFVWLMARSHLVLTDSGGVQEEAPSLGKPVLVMRSVTERPEGVEAGCARIVGVTRESIVRQTEALLADDAEYLRMSSCANPYGDGRAARRIADILDEWKPERG